jgi:DNA adenine methylase
MGSARREPFTWNMASKRNALFGGCRLVLATFYTDVKTVMRYPGGKSRMLKALEPHLRKLLDGASSYAEPFVGGGSVALWVARHYPAVNICVNDKDPLIAAYWKILCGSTDGVEALAERLMVTPTVSLWDRVKCSEPITDVDRAFKAIFLNRTSFNGMIHHSSPIGGRSQTGKPGAARIWTIACQYAPETLSGLIREYNVLLRGRSSAFCEDGCDFVETHRTSPQFVDPPYLLDTATPNRLYGVMMSKKEHERLAASLRLADKWVLTYDFSTDIAKRLYHGAAMHVVPVKYSSTSANRNKKWKDDAELVCTKGL